MADENNTTNPAWVPGDGQAPAQATIPQLQIVSQYIKDLSFENPNAPQALQQNVQPQINVSVNVAARPLAGTDGLGESTANRNEGAESTLAFHRAKLVFDAAQLPMVARRPVLAAA